MRSVVPVVVRTKDRPLLLERVMRSVLTQTVQDFEIIVINDGGDSDAVPRPLLAAATMIRRVDRRADEIADGAGTSSPSSAR
jgi:hypothetical protein